MTENYFAAVERERAADAATVAATVATMLAEDSQPDVSGLSSQRLSALAVAELIKRLASPFPWDIVAAIAAPCSGPVRLHRCALAAGLGRRAGTFIEASHVQRAAAKDGPRRDRARVALALAGLGPRWSEASPAERAAVLLRALVRP